MNPKVIVEVLSKTTQDYDRGAKFEQYRTIESFVEYVLIAQDKPHVEHFVRQPDGRWLLAETNRLDDRIELQSIDAQLALADVYEKVTLSGCLLMSTNQTLRVCTSGSERYPSRTPKSDHGAEGRGAEALTEQGETREGGGESRR